VSNLLYRGSAAVGRSGLPQTTWSGQTSLCLKSTAGSGNALTILFSLNRVVENAADAEESMYELGNIGKGSFQQFPTTGGLLVYLVGSGFGAHDLSPSARFGVGTILSRQQPMLLASFTDKIMSPSTFWISDSSARFLTAMGNGRGTWSTTGQTNAQILVLKIGTITTSATSMFTFLSPVVLPNIQHKISTGSTVHVIGSSFSPWNDQPKVSFASGSVAFVSQWISDSSIQARGFLPVFNRSTSVVVSVASQFGKCLAPWNSSMVFSLASLNVPSSSSILSSIDGQGFGLHQYSSKSQVSQSASQSTQWLSDSIICMKIMQMQGQNFVVSLTINQFSGKSAANMSLFDHSIPDVAREVRFSSSGSDSLSLRLFNGGIFDQSYRCRIIAASKSSVASSLWKSDSSIVVKFNSGLLNVFGVLVSLKRLVASAAGISTLNFTNTTRSQFPSCIPMTGSLSHFIFGSSLDLSDSSVRARLMNTDCQSSAWKSDSGVICKTPDASKLERLSTFLSVPFHGFKKSGSSDEFIIFAQAASVVNSSFSSSSTGSQLVGVTLNSYAVSDVSFQLRSGASKSHASIWLSHSSVVIKFLSGSGKMHKVHVSIPNQLCAENNGSHSFSYTSAKMKTTLTVQNRTVTTGSITCFAVGTGFGLEARSIRTRLKVLASSSLELTDWRADSTLSCKIPAFLFRNISLSMSCEMQQSNSVNINFGINGTLGTVSLANFSNLSMSTHTGGQFIRLVSNMFGTMLVSSNARLASTSFEFSLWLSDSSAMGKKSSRARLQLNYIFVTMNYFLSDFGSVYENVEETKLAVINLSPVPSSASTMATVVGAFSVCNQSPRLKLASSNCLSSTWISSSTLICKTPVGTVSTWTVVASVFLSSSSGFISKVNWSGIPLHSNASFITSGSQSVQFVGRFGTVDSSVNLGLGHSRCMSSVWISDSHIRSKYVSGHGLLKYVHLSVGNSMRPGNAYSSGYSFSLPAVILFNNSAGPNHVTTGSILNQLGLSLGLGTFDHTCRFRFHGSGTEASNWISDSMLLVKICFGINSNRTVTLTIDNQTSKSSTADSIPQTSNLSIGISFLPATGSFLMNLSGKNMIICQGSIGVRLGASASISSQWTSSSSIIARTFFGTESSKFIIISSNFVVETAVVHLSYLQPTITVTSRSTLSTSNILISVTSIYSAGFSQTCAMRVTSSSSPGTRWISSSALTAMSFSGSGLLHVTIISFSEFKFNLTSNISFRIPSLASFADSNFFGSSGARIILLSGSHFGTFDASARSRISASALKATQWISSSSARTKLHDGSNFNAPMFLSVANIKGSSAQVICSDMILCGPSISRVSTSTLMTSGSFQIELVGNHFMMNDFSPRIRFMFSNTPTSFWISDSSMTAKVSSCFLTGNYSVDLSVSRYRTSFFDSRIYSNATNISSLKLNCAPTTGSILITMFGHGFGTSWSSSSVEIGFVSPEVKWNSDSVVVCKLKAVSSSSVKIKWDGVQIPSPVVFFTAMAVSALSKYNSPVVESNARILIFGSQFGIQDPTMTVLIDSKKLATTWISESCVTTFPKFGTGQNLTITINSNSAAGDIVSLRFSFDTLTIVDGTDDVIPTDGGVINIFGTNFGTGTLTIPTASIGLTSCSQVLRPIMDFITCVVKPGTGRGLSVCVYRSSEIFCRLDLFSYHAPSVSSTQTSASDFPATGKSLLTVFGRDFGVTGYCPMHRFARSGQVSTHSTSTLWTSTTSMHSLVSHGVGDQITVFASVSRQSSNRIQRTVSKPLFTNFQALISAPSTSSLKLLFSAMNLGLSGHSIRSNSLKSSSEASTWISDSFLTFKSSHRALYSDVTSVVSVQRNINNRSNTIDKSYCRPELFFTTQTDSSKSSSGSMIVTISGNRFRTIDPSPSARFIRSASEACHWVSDSIIVSKTQAWIQTKYDSHTLLISTNIESSTIKVLDILSETDHLEVSQSIEVTGLFKVNRTNLIESTGSTVLMMLGTFLGGTDSSLSMKMFSTSLPSTAWTSQSSIVCKVFTISSIKHGTAFLSLNSKSFQFSIVSDFSFRAPSLSSSNLSLPSTGSPLTPMAISAAGCSDQTIRLRFQFSASTSSQWMSDSCIISKVSAGLGLSHFLRISIDAAGFSFSWNFSYSSPSLSSSFATNLSSSGSIEIKRLGFYFGIDQASMRTRYFHTSDESTFWTSDSCTHLKAVSFARKSQSSVTVSILGQSRVFLFNHSNVTNHFSPLLLNLSMPSSGSCVLSLSGSNFLQVGVSVKASLRSSACSFSLWKSTSLILCKVPMYSCSSLSVLLSVNQQQTLFTNDSLKLCDVSWLNISYELPTTGSILQLLGAGLGNFGISAKVSLSTSCESTFWMADSSILCKSPQSEAKHVEMFATLATRKVASSLFFSHSLPLISGVHPSSTPSTGLSTLTLSGRGFAFHNLSFSPMRIGSTSLKLTFYISDSSLLTTTPSGEGSVRIFFAGNSAEAGNVSFSFGLINDLNVSLSDHRTGHLVQLSVEFFSSQMIEKFGSFFVYLPSQIRLQQQSAISWSNGIFNESGNWTMQNNYARFQAHRGIPPGKFAFGLINCMLSSTVVPLNPIFVRSSMESNITIDVGSFDFKVSIVPSNSTIFMVTHSTLYAGDAINVSVLLKCFNVDEAGDIFVINFPELGASFASVSFHSSDGLALLHGSNNSFTIAILTSNSGNYSFIISGIILQPFSGKMSSFSGHHSNNLGILKENWIATDNVFINPGKMKNASMQFSNYTIGATMNMTISFITANNLSMNSIVILEFSHNDINFSNEAYLGSMKLLFFFDGNTKMAVQIPKLIISDTVVNISFLNAIINFGSSRYISATFSSQAFHSDWNSSAFYQPTTVDIGISNSILSRAPFFNISSKFSSLQMRSKVYLNMTIEIPNTLPPSGSLEIILKHMNFSATDISLSSNCFYTESSALVLGAKAIFSFRSVSSRAFQNCFVYVGPIQSPGYPGYNGRVVVVIQSEDAIIAYGESYNEHFFVSFISAQITGNCSVRLSWNNTELVDLPVSWAITCSECSADFRIKTYAPHLRSYHYNDMPCLTGAKFSFVLREIDVNGTAVIPKSFLDLDKFESDQWSVTLSLVTLPSAPNITNLNQTFLKRAAFNWLPMKTCYDGNAAFCPIVSSVISVTSLCHPRPDIYSTTSSVFDIAFEFSTNHTVCISFMNDAGASAPSCFFQVIEQPYRSNIIISFVEVPTAIFAGNGFTPTVSVVLNSSIAEPLGGITIFSSFTLNETESFVASYRSCAVTSDSGLATFSNMSFAGIGTATMDAFLSKSQSVKSPKFQSTIGTAAKISLRHVPTVVVAAMAFPQNLIAQVSDIVDNIHTELYFDATLTFTSVSESNRSTTPYIATSSLGTALFKNVSIAAVGDYFGQIHILNFRSSLFFITVMSGASISIKAEVHPSNSKGGEPFSPLQPLLTLRDLGNNIAIDYFDFVTTSIDYSTDSNAKLLGIYEKFSYLGVCRFYDMAINFAGHYRLKYSAVGLIPAFSNTFVVVVGDSFQLAVIKHPVNIVAGYNILNFASVKVVDKGGNLVNTSISNVSADLSGLRGNVSFEALSTACIAGVATFPSPPIRNNGTSYILIFSSFGLFSAASLPFSVFPGPAFFMTITSFPGYGLGGLIFQPAVSLQSTDLWGNQLHSGFSNGPDRTAFVSILGCSHLFCVDKLLGNKSSNFHNGVALFANSAISLVGWYMLIFSIDNVTASKNITVYNSNAAFLTVEREPSMCFGGEECKIQPIITMRDVATNIAESRASNTTVSILANLSSNISWRYLGATASFFRGFAILKDFGFDKVGTYVVTFVSSGIIPCSISVNVVAGIPSIFLLTQSPSLNASGGSAFSIQPILTFFDLGFNIANVTNSTSSVALVFPNNSKVLPSSGILFGDLITFAEGPVVIFKNIGIRTAALGYMLRFSSALVPDLLHYPIDVYPGKASSIMIYNHPIDAFGAKMFSPQPVIWLLDLGGNVATNNHDRVVVSLLYSTNSRSRILGTRNISAISGVCYFVDLAIDLAGTHILVYAAQDISASVSPNITVFVGPSASIRLGIQPSTITGGSQFIPLVHVEVIDLGGNLVVNNSFSIINVSLLPSNVNATLLGNLTSIVSSGVAIFTNITIDKIGPIFSLYFGSEFGSVMSISFGVAIGILNALTSLIAPTDVIAGQCMHPSPAFGLFDAGWNVIYSDMYSALARLSPDSTHQLEFRNTSRDGMFIFECINSTKIGESHISLFISQENLFFKSVNFTTFHGVGHHIVISNFPSTAFCGVPFSSQPLIHVVDAFENFVKYGTRPSISIQASLRNSINNQSLLLGPTVQDVLHDGSAQFYGLYINLFTPNHWTIVFTSNQSNIVGTTSPGIQMKYGDSMKLTIPHTIISAQAGRYIQPYCVSVLDTGGNIKVDYEGSIVADTSAMFTTKMVPTVIDNFLHEGYLLNVSFGRACFSFAFPVKAIFSLVFRLQNEPNISIETSLFMASECELDNISFGSPPIQNSSGGNTLIPHPKIQLNGVGCSSSGTSIFSLDAFIVYANGSVADVSWSQGNLSAYPVNGVVEFKNIAIDRFGGPYAVHFVFGTFTVQSNLFFVSIGPPQIIGLVQQPSLVNIAGENIINQPIVGFFDLGWNLNKTLQFHVIATLLGYGPNSSLLFGNNSISSNEGIAAFQNLKVNLAASNWTIVFSCSGFVSVESMPFHTKIGNPFELILVSSSQPLNATACLFFPVQPVVTIIDKGGNIVPAGSGNYSQEYLLASLKFHGNDTSLYDWEAVPSRSGLFQMVNMTYCSRGFNFVIEFSLKSSPVQRIVSSMFSIPIGIAVNLKVTQEPQNVIAGEIMQYPVKVKAQFYDGSFAPDASMMYVNLVSNSSNISIRIVQLEMSEGSAAISFFLWNRTGVFNFEFNLNGLTVASQTFEVKHGHPRLLTIRTQPSNCFATQNMSPPPEILVLDMQGNFASINGILVAASLLLQANKSVWQPLPTLTGPSICSSRLGVCTFYNISIYKAYYAYSIVFESVNFTFSIVSNEFKIQDGAPVRLSMLSQPPSSLMAGEEFPQPLQVALVDLGDNIAESGSFQITAKSNISTDWTLSNFTSLGVASFFGIAVSSVGIFAIEFSAIGFQSISSSKMIVISGAAIRIQFEAVANGSSVGRLFSTEIFPIVTFRDKGHNVVNVSQKVTLFLNASNNASLGGELTVISLSGVASFQNVYLKKTGFNYQLLASCNNSGNIFFAQSLLFDMKSGPPTSIKIFGSVGYDVNGLKSVFFFTTKLFPSVCVIVADDSGNALYNVSAELSSKGMSNPVFSGTIVMPTDVDGIACFNSLILKGVHNASITFLFSIKFNNSNVSTAVSDISVLPQLDFQAALEGSLISFSSTISVPLSYREATSASFGANLPMIFDQKSLQSFGVGASCMWISDNQFVVTLGVSPSFILKEPILFAPVFLQNLFFFEHSIARYIQVPLNLPQINIVFAGTTLVYACADVRIDIFDSTGSYGRPFATHWRLKNISELQGNYSKLSIFDAVASRLRDLNDSYIVVISKITVANVIVELPAAVYAFEVETIRWVDGKRHVSEILMVTKTNDLLPTVSIVGPKLVSMFVHQSLELKGTASASCGSPSLFTFNWRIADSSNPQNPLLLFTGSSLTVPEYTFSLSSTYDVTLTVASGPLQSWDYIKIVPKRSAPLLIIKGANGTFVLNSDLVLDSSPSIDPDNANFEDVSFEWKCEFRNNSMCDTPISSPQSRIAQVLKSSLISGTTYIFSLVAHIRNTNIISTSAVSLFILPAGAAQVSAISISSKVSPQFSLRLEGLVVPSQELIWSEVTTHGVLSLSNIFPTTDLRALVFRPNVLPPGATLKMRLSTVSALSYAEVQFTVNHAPLGGRMLVSSAPFVADIRLAKITMSGWSDDVSDLPIFFEFTLDYASSSDIVSASSKSSTRNLFLPSVEKLAIVARISDSLGTSNQISQNLVLNNAANFEMKSRSELNSSKPDWIHEVSSKLADVKGAGDSDTLISFCCAILGKMSKSSVNSTEVEDLRFQLILLISESIPAFPPLRPSQANLLATALSYSISNSINASAFFVVKNSALKILNSSLIYLKPTIIEKMMNIARFTSFNYQHSPTRKLLQGSTAIVPDIENFITFLNFLETISCSSLVLGQEVSKYVVPGLAFVAAITSREMLCQEVHILEVLTSTSIFVSEKLCSNPSTQVVLSSWNVQNNPYSSISPVAVTSGVLRLNARLQSGIQMNVSSLSFTFKIYKQPAAWTSMTSLAICVKWEYNVAESDGHWSAKYCQKISEDFDHLICSCTGFSSVAITIISKDCKDEPYGFPGFKADASTCTPEQIIPIAMFAGITFAVLVFGFLAVMFYRHFQRRQALMREHMQITKANIEETHNSIWATESKMESVTRNPET
jgi:hypothetical protein